MTGETVEPIKENVREDLCGLGIWKNFNSTPKAQAIGDKLVTLQWQN